MKLVTTYSQNMFEKQYYSRTFTRTTEVTVHDDATCGELAEVARNQQMIVEDLVRGDIKRHEAEIAVANSSKPKF